MAGAGGVLVGVSAAASLGLLITGSLMIATNEGPSVECPTCRVRPESVLGMIGWSQLPVVLLALPLGVPLLAEGLRREPKQRAESGAPRFEGAGFVW